MTDHSSSNDELLSNIQDWLNNPVEENEDLEPENPVEEVADGHIRSSVLHPDFVKALNNLVSMAEEQGITIQISYVTENGENREMGMTGWSGRIAPCEFLATALIMRGRHDFSHAVIGLAENVPWLLSDDEEDE